MSDPPRKLGQAPAALDEASATDAPVRLQHLRKRAPTGDHRAVEELMAWARRRADEILASLSPSSELLLLLRADDVPAAPVVDDAASHVHTSADQAITEPRDVIFDALPPAAGSDEADHPRVSAVGRSPVAQVLPRGGASISGDRPPPPARRHPRYEVEQPVSIRHDAWQDFVESCTRDISQGGMFIQSSEPPPLRSRIMVRLRLPGEAGVLELEGEVVHVMSGGFGLQFDELTPRRRAMLDRIVAYARAMAEGPARDGMSLQALGLASASSSGLRLTLTPQEIATLRDLKSQLATISTQDDLAVLGLEGEPTIGDIDRAFEALQDRWDPARWPTRPVAEVEELARDILRKIEQAHLRVAAAARSAVPEPVRSPADEGDDSPRDRSLLGRIIDRGGRRTQRFANAAAAMHAPRVSTEEFNRIIGRGFEQLSRKLYPAAVATFRIAVQQRPDSTKAQILLLFAEARQLVQERQLEQAREKYEKVLEIDPGNATAQRDLVMLACLE